MKRILTLILAIILCFSLAACSNKSAIEEIKKEYQSYDFTDTENAQTRMKAQELVAKINALPSSDQKELKEIKTKLDELIKETESPKPTQTAMPTGEPMPSQSAEPSSEPSANPSLLTE